MFKVPEKHRVLTGMMRSDESFGCNGMFILPNPFTRNGKPIIKTIASDREGWEHVSVSIESRIPTWMEMCHVKDLFWDDNDAVMQLHPPKFKYVNNHHFCLHLWRPIFTNVPFPHFFLVGRKDLTQEEAHEFTKLFKHAVK